MDFGKTRHRRWRGWQGQAKASQSVFFGINCGPCQKLPSVPPWSPRAADDDLPEAGGPGEFYPPSGMASVDPVMAAMESSSSSSSAYAAASSTPAMSGGPATAAFIDDGDIADEDDAGEYGDEDLADEVPRRAVADTTRLTASTKVSLL